MVRIDWQSRYLVNTASVYAFTAAKVATGLILFPRYYEYFDETEFGIWALVWSFLGYTLLLDFGMGVTVQRAVARESVNRNLKNVGDLFSTIFWIFMGFGLVLFLGIVGMRGFFFDALDVPAVYQPEAARALFYFAAGLGLIMPLSLFKAVLMGMQRLDIVFGAMFLATIAGFLALWYGIDHGWTLSELMGVAMLSSFGDGLLVLIPAFIAGRGITIAPSRFSWRKLHGQVRFSLYVYGMGVLGVLVGQADRLIVSRVLGLAALTVYQPAWKVGSLVATGGGQILRSVPSAAAHLHAAKAQDKLVDLLLRSSRLSFILGIVLYFPCAAFMQELLGILTGRKGVPDGAWITAQLFLLATLVSMVVGAATKKTLLMTGEERFLFRYHLWSLVLRLALGVTLAFAFGVPGVAGGVLIATLTLNLALIVRRTLAITKQTWMAYVLYHVRGTGLGFLALGVGVLGAAWIWPQPARPSVAITFLKLLVSTVPALALLRRSIRETWIRSEREVVARSCAEA
ncbi:MAG TPA: lipopolysaccharide biosynthesis protein [Verrucomicrobiales bacterium]|nr:lipopolysaccharide biosynthesis protein [Verrucomicrobiales bacterium]